MTLVTLAGQTHLLRPALGLLACIQTLACYLRACTERLNGISSMMLGKHFQYICKASAMSSIGCQLTQRSLK